ncbi:MAG: tail fiber domain-containing protein [Bacteroidia bacterium]
MKLFLRNSLIVLAACSSFLTYAQNIGIGTISPETKLSVNGGISLMPNTGAAAALITIPDNVSVFRVSNVAGTQANALTLVSPKEGQYLTIYNEDNNAASFSGTTISSTIGVATFVYINGGWRTIANSPGFNGGTLDYAYDYGGAGLGRTITADAGAVLIQGIDGLQSTGTLGSGAALALSGAGTRMFWYPKKAAFRAGFVDGTQWNDANIGDQSIAMGEKTIASGTSSFAVGRGSTASGAVSTAAGAFATASNVGAISMGLFTTSSGNASMAVGVSTVASGNTSLAMGQGSVASGSVSIAMGSYSTASGTSSVAMGDSVVSSSFAETVVGRYNTIYSPISATNWSTNDRIFTVGNGTTNALRSNAMVVLKNGNIGIGASAPSAPTMGLHQVNNNGILAEGTFGAGNVVSATAAGTRMVWYPRKAAFRAGRVTALQWEDVSIGNYSFAGGLNNTASGATSFAVGNTNTASGASSAALNNNNAASGINSFAIGFNTDATGDNSFSAGEGTLASGNHANAWNYFTEASGFYSNALGYFTEASGDTSLATGYNSVASGNTATAMGYITTASGNNSTAMGFNSTAAGSASTALGNFTLASGDNSLATGLGTTTTGASSFATGFNTAASGTNSFVTGENTTAASYAETVVGAFNTTYTPASSIAWDVTDRAFTVGNGTSSIARSDAMVILKNGKVGIGTSAPVWNLDVRGATTDSDGIIQAGNSDQSHFIRLFGGRLNDPLPFMAWKDGDPLRFATDGGGFFEVARFHKVGANYFMGINTMSPTEQLEVTGNVRVNGNICYTGSIGACSDMRYKKNLSPLSSQILTNIMNITPYYYEWKQAEFPERGFDDRKQIGFMAQEMEQQFPEIVNTDGKGYKSIDYSKATPILWQAVKELNQNQVQLTSDMQQLNAEMEAMKAELEALKAVMSAKTR